MTDPVIDLSRLDLDAMRELCAELLATVKSLEQRVVALETKPTPLQLYPNYPGYNPWGVGSGQSTTVAGPALTTWSTTQAQIDAFMASDGRNGGMQ